MTTEATGTGALPPQAGEPNLYADGSTSATPPAPAEGQAPAPAPAANSPAAAPTAPDTYEFKMPEGVELDAAAATEFTTIAKELKLDQATAQKVADVGAKMVQRQAEAHQLQVESWLTQTKADKEIGGEKLDENLATARKAIDTFGTPALKELLNASGLGNHPEVIKAFFKAGKAISEDSYVSGSAKGGAKDVANILFPNMN